MLLCLDLCVLSYVFQNTCSMWYDNTIVLLLHFISVWFVLDDTKELKAFTDHISAVNLEIKFTCKDVRDDDLAFLDYAVHIYLTKTLRLKYTVRSLT